MQVTHELLELRKQEFFDLAEVKNFLRITTNYDDALIKNIINAAIEIAERYTMRCINQRLIKCVFSAGGKREIKARLKYFPLTAKVQLRGSRKDQEPEDLDLNFISCDDQGEVIKIINPDRRYFSAELLYEAGYGPADIPCALRQSILNHIAYMYEYDPKCVGQRGAGAPNFYKQFRHIRI